MVQVYVSGPASGLPRPPLQLAAFATVRVEPGELAIVDLQLQRERLALWDVEQNGWTVDPGQYGVRVGRSSRDICLITTVVTASGGRP